MNTNTTTVRKPMLTLATVRDDLRVRRAARREQRELVRELATYSTRAEVDDLLAVIDRHESVEAEEIRTILTRNLQNNHVRRPLAS